MVPVSLREEVTGISSLRVYIAKDLRAPEARELGLKTLAEVEKRFPKEVPLLDPQEDMHIKVGGGEGPTLDPEPQTPDLP